MIDATDNLFDIIEKAIAESLFKSESTVESAFDFIFDLAYSIHKKIPRSTITEGIGYPSANVRFTVKWSRDCKDQNLKQKVISYELNFSFKGIEYYVFDICSDSFKWEDPDLMQDLDNIISKHAIL